MRSPSFLILLLLSFVLLQADAGPLRRVPQQYRSIQSAINAARVGDTVLVDEGLYYENLRINKNIVLASRFILDRDTAHVSRTIVDGSRASDPRRKSTIVVEAPSLLPTTSVIGFSIRGGKGTVRFYPYDTTWGRSGGGIDVYANGVSILHNWIHDNHVSATEDSLWVAGGALSVVCPPGSTPRTSCIIRDNVIEKNSLLGPTCFGAGIATDGPAIIERNTVRWNICRATKHYANGGGMCVGSNLPDTVFVAANRVVWNGAQRSGGIIIVGNQWKRDLVATVVNNIVLHNTATERGGGTGIVYAAEVFVVNNTIMHNRAGGFGGGIDGQYANIWLMNNIIAGNAPDEQVAYQTIFPASHNLIQHGFPGKATIDELPQFTDDSTGLMLSQGSPCIGAGTMQMKVFGKTVHAPPTDIFGTPRGVPPKSNPDLGATESPYFGSARPKEDRLVKISVIIRPLRSSEKYVDSTTGFIQTTAVQYFMDDTLLINDEIRSAGVTLERHGIPIHMECFVASPSSRVAYRTTLTGRDFGWTQRSDKQLIRYTGLESGSYIFKIQSKTPSHDHPWVESSLRIIIPPPWWEQWWFYALLIGTTVALVSLVYRRELFRARSEHLLQQTFTQQQMESQESERKRLASELHDGLGQDLLVVNTELRQLLADRPERSENLQRITGLVQESIDSVREISSNLHPHHIDRLGLCAAVEALIEKISRSASLRIESSCDPVDGAMTKEAKLHVYRIIQESLANAVKHSHATAVHVAIQKDGRGIAVSIRDDGKGFDGSITPLSGDGTRNDHARGFGFASMAERARIIGATFSVDSAPGRGTAVHLIIPDGKG